METTLPRPGEPKAPLLVAVDMGYGHRRPAAALAEELRTEVLSADAPPLVDAQEAKVWKRARGLYEWATRTSSIPLLGAPLRPLVQRMTDIPPMDPDRDQSAPNWGARKLAKEIKQGLGARLVETLRASGRPLLTTYFAPAIAADTAGLDEIYCVVTDSDINRAWVPLDPSRSRIRYLAPTQRVVQRLQAYGVTEANIHRTGFPLPGELLGGPDLSSCRRNLAARLVRLDPEGRFREAEGETVQGVLGPFPQEEAGRPPLLTFAVGGAGAQTDLPRRFLPGLASAVSEGRLRISLVAGVREEAARVLHSAVHAAGLADQLGAGVEVLHWPSYEDYFPRFNALLAETDILWTKPSELTFFAGLGIPLLLAPPIGSHERYNGLWAKEHGAALDQQDLRTCGQWVHAWLEDGVLAAAAWAGFENLPTHGLYQIAHLFDACGA